MQISPYETTPLITNYQAYMQGHIRGFMHLDNGQETIPALIADRVKIGDIKHSYYREHTHALASKIPPGPIMAELFGKVTLINFNTN